MNDIHTEYNVDVNEIVICISERAMQCHVYGVLFRHQNLNQLSPVIICKRLLKNTARVAVENLMFHLYRMFFLTGRRYSSSESSRGTRACKVRAMLGNLKPTVGGHREFSTLPYSF